MRTKKEILNHIVYVGKQNLPQGGRLILYGSQARGTATDSSDWDLLIILDKPKIEQSDYDNVSFPFMVLGWNLGQLISPVLYTKEEWDNNSFTPFYKDVQQDAIYLKITSAFGDETNAIHIYLCVDDFSQLFHCFLLKG